METQLEDGPEDQEHQQVLGSEKIRILGCTEVLKSSVNCGTEQEFIEKTENEEKLSPDDMVIQLSTSEQIIFVPNSDAECSDPIVDGTDMVSSELAKQQQQLQNAEESRTGILDSVNDADSNGSFELIDEGRVGDVDSLPDQDIDSDVGSMRQQQCRESIYEVGHIRQEAIMEAEEEHVAGSECVATVRVQDDVHDVQVCACKKKLL